VTVQASADLFSRKKPQFKPEPKQFKLEPAWFKGVGKFYLVENEGFE
jgi:hypothetical protein